MARASLHRALVHAAALLACAGAASVARADGPAAGRASAHRPGPVAAAGASDGGAAAPRASEAPTATAGPWVPPPLRLHRVHGRARFTLTPATEAGGWDEADMAMAKECFAWRGDAFRSQHEVHPRLLDLAYRAMRHFGAAEVELISGFRDGRTTSRHSHGRAMDIRLPGVDLRRLAEFFYRQGFVGVGIYPRSRFVHVDVRAQSYFWVDHSRAGRRGRARPILGELARRMDAAALARGEHPDADVARAEHDEREAFERGDEVARFGRARAQRRQARREALARRGTWVPGAHVPGGVGRQVTAQGARRAPARNLRGIPARRIQNETRRITARGNRRMTAMTAPQASGA